MSFLNKCFEKNQFNQLTITTFIKDVYYILNMANWLKSARNGENLGIDYVGKINECNHCGSKEQLILHHVSYEPEIFKVLCRSCHIKFHRQFPDRGPESEKKHKGKPRYTTITIKSIVKKKLEDFAFEMKYPRIYSWGKILEEMMKEVEEYRLIKNRYKLK